jgi:hypothetical protein
MGKEADAIVATRYEQEAREYDHRADETEKLLSDYSQGVSQLMARQYVECMRSAAKLSRGMANVHRLRNGKSQ